MLVIDIASSKSLEPFGSIEATKISEISSLIKGSLDIGSSVISFLCNNYSFNKSRVEKALEKYIHARNPSRQLTLGDF